MKRAVTSGLFLLLFVELLCPGRLVAQDAATPFQLLQDLAGRGPITLPQARAFFQKMQVSAGPGQNVWELLRATKRVNQKDWAAVQAVENQLVALVRTTLVTGREQIIRRGNLGTVFAFLDSGKWRNRAETDLFFDTDFDTTFFADRLAEADPKSKDGIIAHVESMLREQLGVGSSHLGIELTGFGYEALNDNYVSKSGVKWALRESASHLHLIDPVSGAIGQNIAGHPNVLFARQQQAALRERHPELFEANGRLRPGISPAQVRQLLQAEPGLSRSERMFAEGSAMNLTDAALAPIDMACHLTETQQATKPSEQIAKIGKQVARSSAVFIEGIGGANWQQGFTPAELNFMGLTRALETAKVDRAAAEAEITRFMETNADASTWTESQAAELDRLVERARTQRSLVEGTLVDIQGRWSAGSMRQVALTVMKKQAKAGFDAVMQDMLGRPAAERTRALADFAQEMQTLASHYEGKGAPAEMLQWARTGLENVLILREMSRDPRFTDLWAAFERMGRAGPREIARVKDFLSQSVGGRRLLERVGVALDNMITPPSELTLGHPMVDAGRSLREIAGGYTAMVGHAALLVGLVDSASQAKNNEELATGIAQTLISTTQVGLILQEGQRFFDGDPAALLRLANYLVVPETMLPALVEALGHSTINLGTAVAFDTQLDALFLVSTFDGNGDLLTISDTPRGQLPEWISDVLTEATGEAWLQDMLNKAVNSSNTFLAEQAKGINASVMKTAVTRALRATLERGNHLVFRDDQTLAAVCGNIRKYGEEIRYLAEQFKISPPPDADAAEFYAAGSDPQRTRPNTPGWASSLDAGQLRALAQLYVARDAWRTEARSAFLATLVRTLEERHRAEADVDAKLRDTKRDQLMAIFDELDIRDEGTTAYEQLAGYNLMRHLWNVTLGFATERERAVHEMKALNRFLDVYTRVRDLRFAMQAEISQRTGKSPVPQPLTSVAAVTGVPEIDFPSAEQLAKAVSPIGDALSLELTGIKQAPLDGDYDTLMFARIYEARYQRAYWDEVARNAAALNRQSAIWKVVAKTDLYALGTDASNHSRQASKLADDLIEEFRSHYAAVVLSGEVRVSPQALVEGDGFTASAVLTKGVAPKNARWQWQATGGVRLQTTEGAAVGGTAQGSGTVRARLTDSAGKVLADYSADISAKPKDDDKKKEPPPQPPPPTNPGAGTFSASVIGNWEGGNTPRGFVLTRKPAKIKGPCGWDASVSASIEARFAQAAKPKDAAEASALADTRFKARRQGETPNDMAVGLFMAGGKEGVSGFAMGGYQGAIADFALWMRRGSWGEGYTGASFGANGIGDVVKQGGVISFSYHVRGSGCWDNSDRAYLITQGVAAQEEARSILASLQLDDKGLLTSKPYDGPKYDGSDLARVVLVPSQIAKLKPGDTVTLEAVVENAKPEDSPFNYTWGGTFDGTPETSKKSPTVRIKPAKAGKYSVSVAVDGARFGLGSASVEYTVVDYRVKIERDGPANAPLVVGSKTGFTATLTVDGAAAAGNFVYRWEPSTELTWAPAEGAQARTQAVFTESGKTKVWVVVLEKSGEVLTTVAESDRLELDVTNPVLKIAFAPETAVVGAPVKATIQTTPADIKEIDFRWETPANARLLNESQDAREITFSAKDTNPIQVTARARVPVSGEDLGEATATFTAKKFDVKVAVLGPQGPKPQVWKEKIGLVTVENAIAVHQNVAMRADVSPQVDGIEFRYEWTVNEDSHIVDGGISSEARFNRSQVGTCVATVVVRNQDGLELGRGQGTFNATISEAMMSGGGQKKDAADKVATAKTTVRKGQLDEAIALVTAAASIDPTNTEAVSLANKWTQERDTCHVQIEKTRQLMTEEKFPEASNALVVAKNLHYLYKPVLDIEKEMNEKWTRYDSGVKDGVGQIQMANDARDFKKALELVAALRNKFKLIPVTENTVRDYEAWARTHEAEKDRIRGVMKQGEAKFNAGDYDGALADFAQLWVNFDVYWNNNFDTEPRYYAKLRNDALVRRDRIRALMPQIKLAAESPVYDRAQLQAALTRVDEVLSLQPDNGQAQGYKRVLADRLNNPPVPTPAPVVSKPAPTATGNALAVTISPAQQSVNSGDNLTTAALAVGGTPPYTYAWFNGDSRSAVTRGSVIWTLRGPGPRTFKVVVTDAAGNKAEAQSTAVVVQAQSTAAVAQAQGAEVITVPAATGSAISSKAVLENGKKYSLEISGVFSYWDPGGGTTGADALYDYRGQPPALYSALVINGTPLKDWIEASGRKADYRSDHVYAVVISGNGKPLTVSIFDPGPYSDNSGSLTVKVGVPGGSTSPSTPPPAAETSVFDSGNISSVGNQPTAPATFTIQQPHIITSIMTYHWNNGRGTRPGTIALRDATGRTYGPWSVTGTPGQGGVPNASWTCAPNIEIPAGTYTIVDSEPATWSQNAQSGGRGFAVVKSHPAGSTAQPTPSQSEKPGVKKGYWRLADRKLEKTPSTSQCYPSEVLGGEGNLTVNARSVCGEDGLVSVQVRWTPPPETLVPGEKLRIDSTLTPKVVRTARGIAPSLVAYIDDVAVPCGYVGPGHLTVTQGYAAGYGKPGGSGTGEAVVPDFGAMGSKGSGKIQVKLCGGSWGFWHQYYVYEWVK